MIKKLKQQNKYYQKKMQLKETWQKQPQAAKDALNGAQTDKIKNYKN